MAFRLTPRDDRFYDLFAGLAAHLVAAADELTSLAGARDDAERKAISKRVSDIENAADDAAHQVLKTLRSAFVTPFDRGDVQALTAALDDCLDSMDAAADLVRVHQVDEFSPRMGRQVDVLVRMSQLTLDAMPHLRDLASLSEFWIEINRLQNQAAKNHRRLVAEILKSHPDAPLRAMALVRVVDAFAGAADRFEALANLLESIAVKET